LDRSATTADIAVNKLKKSKVIPDLMIVDFRLSDEMIGPEVVQIVTTQLGFLVPALIVTGDTTEAGLKEIVGSGYRHLHKPVDVGELLNLVNESVNS